MPTATIVDTAVHPALRYGDELREYLPPHWQGRYFPPPERYYYPAPRSEFRRDLAPAEGALGSDPQLMARHLFDERGVDVAILLPLTRGLVPDLDLASAICAATNDWLAEKWLASASTNGRFRGSIRVNATDPVQAVREIERWAEHPAVVQVAVTMQAHRPYGQRCYFPIWEAAARHDLPVVVHADGGAGVEFWPTCVGFPNTFLEYAAQYPLNFAVHLFSLIAEGVFERLENLVFVFADGGLDMLGPLVWRLDKDWRPTRFETPWVKRRPVDYLRDHVRFCAQKLEGPLDSAQYARWLDVSGAAELLLFASNYPCFDFLDPRDAFAGAPEELRTRVLGENARRLYRLDGAAARG
jgi:predicted TIM-barrel fold metal-dependent hydrolase